MPQLDYFRPRRSRWDLLKQGPFAVVEGDALTGGPGVRTARTRYETWLGARP